MECAHTMGSSQSLCAARAAEGTERKKVYLGMKMTTMRNRAIRAEKRLRARLMVKERKAAKWNKAASVSERKLCAAIEEWARINRRLARLCVKLRQLSKAVRALWAKSQRAQVKADAAEAKHIPRRDRSAQAQRALEEVQALLDHLEKHDKPFLGL